MGLGLRQYKFASWAQPEKAELPNEMKSLGKVTFFSAVQSLNAFSGILYIELPKVTVSTIPCTPENLLMLAKSSLSMLSVLRLVHPSTTFVKLVSVVIELGIVSDFRLVQPLKILPKSVFTELGRVAEVKPVQFS